MTASVSAFTIDFCSHHTHITLNGGIVDNFIDVVGGDARLCSSSCNVQDFSSIPAYFAHRILFLLVQNCNLVPVDKDLL